MVLFISGKKSGQMGLLLHDSSHQKAQETLHPFTQRQRLIRACFLGPGRGYSRIHHGDWRLLGWWDCWAWLSTASLQPISLVHAWQG